MLPDPSSLCAKGRQRQTTDLIQCVCLSMNSCHFCANIATSGTQWLLCEYCSIILDISPLQIIYLHKVMYILIYIMSSVTCSCMGKSASIVGRERMHDGQCFVGYKDVGM